MGGYENFQVKRNRKTTNKDVFEQPRNYNMTSKNLTRSEKLMNGIALWTGFYRYNPHRFAEEYFGLRLKLFQKILLMMMNYSHYFMYLAARGQGKSFITGLFCAVRCILYPDTKAVIASGNKMQAKEVIEKIEEIRINSPNLAREIKELRTAEKDANVNFHNGSWIQIVASNEGARSEYTNCSLIWKHISN